MVFSLFSSGMAETGECAEDHRRPIRIGRTDWGKAIVAELKASQGDDDITSQRREHKSVISISTLHEILDQIGIQGSSGVEVFVPGGEKLKFKRRQGHYREGYLNGTFTIYGTAAAFQNDGNTFTKIRLRARIYLDVKDDFSTVERSPDMPDWAYLEIKVKNPTPREKGGSNKYRLKLRDADLALLFNADPFSPEFDSLLDGIKERALRLSSDSVKGLNTVNAVFSTIKKVSQLQVKGVQIGRNFLKPLIVTTYIRESYSFKEADYPTPKEVGGKDDARSKRFWPSQNKAILLFTPKKIEYQLTIDYGVRAFLPKPDSSGLFDLGLYFAAGFNSPTLDEVIGYPRDSVAIEFKEPVEVAILPFHFRSPIHQYLTVQLERRMRKEVIKAYQVDKGKAGHLLKFLDKIGSSG